MTASAVRRGLLAAGALAVGLYAGGQSLAVAVRQSPTDVATRLAPGNAQVLAARAEALTGTTADPGRFGEAVAPARAALLRDPLTPSAAATLGFAAAMRGDDTAARRALAYSQAISRRDFKTHLWAIEYSVARGDVAGALRHYDIALRTARQAPDILFPVLAGAVADPGVRRQLLPVLLRHPPWAQPFVTHLANEAPDRGAAALVLAALRASGSAFPPGAEASLLGALASSRNFASARRYLAGDAGWDARRSRHPRFAGNPDIASPFDWTLPTEPGLEASIAPGSNGGGVLAFSALPGAGGPVLRQLHLLPPGRYVVASRLGVVEPDGAALLWTVQCVDGGEIAQAPALRATGSPRISAAFSVAAGCPAQWLTLAISPNDAVGGVQGELDYAELRPAARTGVTQ